ncbi:hypothetical protein O6H91_19G048300 [Diphasiastrum complanatum]|uniref:Uncharacterized protein n=1 Tax=Diphasiastrum complanatum TaxID=34168 RepID=A0ACC2AUW8_DIPCM|nr:hypothetical protein O6H91_19G048300 [Diphasiastrum complanatum]
MQGFGETLQSIFWPSNTDYGTPPLEAGDERNEDGEERQQKQQAKSVEKSVQDRPAVMTLADGKRLFQKVKGYFDLAKEEIDRGVGAEEYGLATEAIVHYKNARRILLEGLSMPALVDSSISHAEEIIKYKGKMVKWQTKVAERLQVLERRPALHSRGLSSSQSLKISTRVPSPQLTVKQISCSLQASTADRDGSFNSTSARTRKGPQRTQSTPVKGLDPKLAEIIENEIVDRSPAVKWDDVAGLAKAKQALMEMVILPTKRSDLFTGLRKPARGLLLFGPPGNGKTMLAKAVASESVATFFSISSSSLTSKWVGEGEKLMRALFAVASARQPSVVFFDEIDSIMSTRSANEHEASRRLKSEFLVQFDGVMSNQDDRVIVMGATNRPQELDDAVRRRLVKRIYVELPDEDARRRLLQNLLKGRAFQIPGSDLERLVQETGGYSGSDLHALCEEAAMIPIRELGSRVSTISADKVRPLNYADFKQALKAIRPSVSKDQLYQFQEWNEEFGSS